MKKTVVKGTPWCWLLQSQALHWCGLRSQSLWKWNYPLYLWCLQWELPCPYNNVGPLGCQQSRLGDLAETNQLKLLLCSWDCIDIKMNYEIRNGFSTRLADKETNIISEDWSVPVQKVTGQLHHHRQLGQFFEHLASLKPQISAFILLKASSKLKSLKTINTKFLQIFETVHLAMLMHCIVFGRKKRQNLLTATPAW